ncbi:MAG: hypothetical protein JSS74_05680 [Actinobacteria bacterium]|nr:hypothetical protein [Actinomycetota bacterium]
MGAILRTTGRVLLRYAPQLLAWFLAGWLGNHLALQLAGFVGGWWNIGGLLLLPLAVLARLIGFVAMFLVARDALHELGFIASAPQDARERRVAFFESLLAGILPFYAVYAAYGFLRDDFFEYLRVALQVHTGRIWNGEDVTGEDLSSAGFGIWTWVIIVVAYALRWAWKRWSGRAPRVFALGAVYLEAVWLFFFVWTLADITRVAGDWVAHRSAMVWFGEVREAVTERIAVLGWIWDGVLWLLGQLGGVLLQPLAWLAVAGVIYGQAIAAERLTLSPRYTGNRYVTAAARRVRVLPEWVRTRLGDIWDDLLDRFRPVGRSLLLMWRAGPVVIGSYVLLYTIVLAIQGFAPGWIVSLIGPQDLVGFWQRFQTPIFLLVPMIIEPVRIAIVAAGYDATLGSLRRGAAAKTLERATAEGATPQEAAAAAVLQASRVVEDVVPEAVDVATAAAVAGTDQGSTENRGNGTSANGSSGTSTQ